MAFLQHFCKSHNIAAATVWGTVTLETGEVSGVKIHSQSADLPPELRSAMEDNTEVALRTSQQTSRIATGQSPCFVISKPLPAKENLAVCMAFIHTDDNGPGDAHGRSQQVASASFKLSILQLQADNHTLSEQLAQAKSPNPGQPSTNASTPLPALLRKWTAMITGRSRKAQIAVAGIALTLASFIPWPYSIPCQAVCEPASRRFVCAPFESRLMKVHVVPGQRVAKGQLLAMLDGSELRSSLAAIEAQQAQAKQRHHAGLVQGDASKAEIERLEVERLKQEADLLNSRKSQIDIRAPIAGVVVQGDLQGTEGASLAVGRELFEIAPLEKMRVEIAVPESDVAYARTGQVANVRLTALPSKNTQVTITSIHPRSELLDDSSVFVAEALIDNTDATIRPGMVGKARLQVGYEPAGKVLLRRPLNSIRQTLGW